MVLFWSLFDRFDGEKSGRKGSDIHTAPGDDEKKEVIIF